MMNFNEASTKSAIGPLEIEMTDLTENAAVL